MVTNHILLRTFFIKGTRYGTAFAIDIDGEEYLVTAKHLLDTATDRTNIKLFHSEKWCDLDAKVIGHGRGEVDISVLQLDQRLAEPNSSVTAKIDGLYVGQEVFFLGFPYKMWSNVGPLMGGLPCAYAKKGMVSAFQINDPQVIHVDAINNEGFSGGPLFFSTFGNPSEIRIAGVVSKFRVEYEKVIDARGEETEMTVAYNTGFLVAYGTKYISEIINSYKKNKSAGQARST